MTAPTYTPTSPNIGVPGGGLYTDNGNFTTDGSNGNVTIAGTCSVTGASTFGGNTLISNKKLGAVAAGDILDLSAAQGQLKLGPTSTTLKLALACTTNQFVDNNNNQINSCSKATGSTNAATAHNYAGGVTPTIVIGAITGTATAWSFGSVTSTQFTPAMTSAGAYTAYVALI